MKRWIGYLLMPSIRDTSIMLKLIMVLLYMMTEWLLWMKPMPARVPKGLLALIWHVVAEKPLRKPLRHTVIIHVRVHAPG